MAESAARGKPTPSCSFWTRLVVKIRDSGHVINSKDRVAIAVNMEGNKEVLGLGAADNEGAKFGCRLMNELPRYKDFIACVDGLKG